MNCLTCGLLEKEKERAYCLRFNKEIILEAGPEASWECVYYFKIMAEDGEPLTPRQHLIMQDEDFRSKKMRGPL